MATYKTAVVGDIATCLPFRAMGVTAIIVEETKDLSAAVRELVKSGEYGAIFVAEEISEEIQDVIEEARYKTLPSMILIPTVQGSMGKGKGAVRETMKRAAGRDIMREE